MFKHWAVVIALGTMMLAATVWTSCGDDEGADAGAADTGGGGGGGKDTGGGGTPDGGGTVNPCLAAEFGSPCEGGYCASTVCAPSCDTVGDLCDDGACFSLGFEDKAVCAEAGDLVEGDECEAINECETGLTCLDGGDGTAYCWLVCADTADCTDPQTCEDSGLGFSLCMETE